MNIPRNLMLVLAMLCLAGCRLPTPGLSSKPASLMLADQGKTTYVITLSSDHSAAEGYAAEELARHLKEITGAEFAIVTPAERGKRPAIVVGPGAAHSIVPDLNLDGLGPEGIVVRTHGRHVILTGGPGAPRGTLYAAYHFLDNVLGVRWWAKDATFVPRKPELQIDALNVTQQPVFELRQLHFNCAWEQDWSARNRINRLTYATWIPDVKDSTV